jgi:long-chain fatty acid transport protein
MRSIALAALLTCLAPGLAAAGGLSAGTNGTEVMSRGGAWVAKADSPLALEHNVAGLARQRGTKLLWDGNLTLHDLSFQRAGVYPGDPNDPNTPFAGQPFPLIQNQGGPFYAPFVSLTTDFEKLDRWTFAIGLFGPPSVGNRNYGGQTLPGGLPNPGRYDFVQASLLVVYPSVAAAVRVTRWLDLGLGLHVAVGTLKPVTVSYSDLGPGLCPSAEYPQCDARTALDVSGATATFSFGALIKPLKWLAFGVNLFGPTNLKMSGTLTPTAPPGGGLQLDPTYAELTSRLPWQLRIGARLILAKNERETADLEVDGVYEAWRDAQGTGVEVFIPELGPFGERRIVQVHNYRDTFAVRVGGSYNLHLKRATLHFRAGFFFDSAATTYPYTRIDFDTIAKYAGTAGFGFTTHGFTFNLGYAYIGSPERVVTNGEIRPSASIGDQASLPVVNNGTYNAYRHVLSFGVILHWEELLKKKRVVRWQ